MMNENGAGDALDRWLREAARRDLADSAPRSEDIERFTARVMSRLPETRRRAWVKPVLVLGSAALGSILAAAFAPVDATLVQGFLDLAHHRLTPAAIAGLAMSGALVICALVLAAESE